MDLLLDNIIFGLQRYGGISVYWAEILKRSSYSGVTWIEPVNALENISRNALKLKFQPTRDRLPTELGRYTKVPCSSGAMHSSYYRVPESKRVKLVTSVYDFTYERYRVGPALWIHHAQKMRALKRSDSIICISQSTANDVVKYGGKELAERIRVIHLGASDIFKLIVDAKIQLSDRHPWLTKVMRKSKLLLFVGARTAYKRFDLAVRAAELSQDAHLIVIGGGDPSQKEHRLVETLVKEERITFVPSVSSSEIPLWYSVAYALLYLSEYEGFGLPILEAARCMCPVIVQNTSSVPELYGDKSFLLPPSPTGEDVHQQLEQLDSSIFRKTLLNTCYTKSLRFSWEQCWQETLEVYERI
jgi:mannosyltransferase